LPISNIYTIRSQENAPQPDGVPKAAMRNAGQFRHQGALNPGSFGVCQDKESKLASPRGRRVYEKLVGVRSQGFFGERAMLDSGGNVLAGTSLRVVVARA
jgi:hypothetical protein